LGINVLILLQKKVVRTIDNADRLAFSQPIFKKLGLLTLVDINLFQKGVLCIVIVIIFFLEAMIMFLFLVFKTTHQYETRTAQNLRTHQCRTTLKSHMITYQGPVYWNSLHDNVKNLANLSSFKSQLKVPLLKKYSI
jgi:hypothetical protein